MSKIIKKLIEQHNLAEKTIAEKGLVSCPKCGFAEDFLLESSGVCYECSSEEQQRKCDEL